MQCNKCSHTIYSKKERYTVCEGKCAKRYHAACVGLSETTVIALFSKNILWMCDGCLLDFCNSRDANATDNVESDACCTQRSTCEAEIEDLKTKVNDIIDALNTIVSERSQLQPETCAQRQHSTPVSSSPSAYSDCLLDGTKDANMCESMSVNATVPNTDLEETFSLFVTNIDRNTTENDIAKLACECLKVDDRSRVRVRKLVSKQKELELDYISFKIVFEKKFKSMAMEPSTWPKHVRFREFQNRCIVWKPNHS